MWHEAGHRQRRLAKGKELTAVCVQHIWLYLVVEGVVVCVHWQQLTGSTFKYSGGVVWVRLHVDIDSSGGSESGGSKVKGKGKIKWKSWLGEVGEGCIMMWGEG